MKRYHEMTQNERIQHSDKIAVMQLQEELTQKPKKPLITTDFYDKLKKLIQEAKELNKPILKNLRAESE